MSVISLDRHLTHSVVFQLKGELLDAVQVLLAADTCFAVIGGELELRFHERGLGALREAGFVTSER